VEAGLQGALAVFFSGEGGEGDGGDWGGFGPGFAGADFPDECEPSSSGRPMSLTMRLGRSRL